MAESIPVGYRFSPTDTEILVYLESLILIEDDDQNHLRKDIVYYNFIRWATLYDMKPWELFKDAAGYYDDNDLYFLTPLKKKFKNGTRNARTVKTTLSSGEQETIGTWKFQSGPTYIVDYNTSRKPLGVKREATFVPSMTEDHNQDQDAAGTSSSGCSSSKKRKHTPEEMEGIRYIMHEYCLHPCDGQVYSLCRIRRKIDKKKIIINKKMRKSSSSTTNTTTTTTTTTSTVVQPVQEEMAAGYDHHQQENNNICYNDGQQQQEAVLPPEGDVKIISDDDKGLANVAKVIEYDDHHQEVMNNAAEVSEINIHPHGGNNIFHNNGQQQQQQQMAGYEHNNHYHHQEVMNNTGPVSESNIHPHVQISDDDKRSTQEIEEDLEIPAEWRRGATAELGFFNIEEELKSCH